MGEGLEAARADALEALASGLDGVADAGADCLDDDDRARLYHRAAATPAAHELLRVALSLEPDELLVAEVLIGALEHAPADALADWLDLITPSSPRFEYAKRRAQEAALLWQLIAPTAKPPGAPALNSWSDWLQRRLAARAESAAVLAELAASGRARRVRHVARSRLRQVRSAGVVQARLASGMDRQEAASLATVVQASTGHDVRVVPDEHFYAVEVRVEHGGDPGTFLLRDESDWRWLSERIGRRG